MSNVRLIRSIGFTFLLSVLVGISGCSVLTTVGGWFSQGYDNTVAYFNAYYNAKKLFDEAESEVLAAQIGAKGRSNTGGTAVAVAPPKQKFALVIDKCSNILAFSPQSSVVDDALFLIGKSFYYQDDYVKAERKFTELVAQYPDGPLALEGQLWLLKTLLKLNRYDDGMKVGVSLVDAAIAAEEDDIAAEVLATLADFAITQNKSDLAIDFYAKSVAQSTSGEFQASTQSRIGDLYFSGENYDKAVLAYREVQRFSPDIYTLYYGQLREAISLRTLKRFDDAFAIFKSLETDYRFLEYRNTIRLEFGETLLKADQIDEAVAMYRLIDSVYTRTPAGAKGAFELGNLLQYRLGEYADARTAYSHAVTGGDAELGKEAQRRVTVFDRLFTLRTKLFNVDSILSIYDVDSMWVVKDTSGKAPSAGLIPGAMDTAAARRAQDSTKTARLVSAPDQLPDSSRVARIPGVPKTARPPKDTLLASVKIVSFEMGELFATEFDAPDSAYFWLSRSLELGLDSVKAPRALFALAGIAASAVDSTYGNAKELYRAIMKKYPLSNAAEESRIALGLGPTPRKEDAARFLFMSAESLMYAGRYAEAIDSLNTIVLAHTESPLVPKSLFSIAWIYENQLARPDSALAQYKTLSTRFGTSTYGAVAARRIPPVQPDSAAAARVDSTLTKQPSKRARAVSDTSSKSGIPDLQKPAVDTTSERPRFETAPNDSMRVPKVIDDRGPAASDTSRSRRAKPIEEK